MKVKIIRVKDGRFEAGDGSGDKIPYYWVTAERVGAEGQRIRFQFGTKRGDHEEGGEYGVELYQAENNSGKLIWKEDYSE